MTLSRSRFVKISLLAWLAFLAVDFLFHGALLAKWYASESPSLLSLEVAFARIPLGYAGFLLLVVLIVWLGDRLGVSGASEGLRFGAFFGVLKAASHGMGLVSIVNVDPLLIFWWSVAEVFEISAAGCVVGHGLAAEKLGRLAIIVGTGAVIVLVGAILVQNI
jgi:hypothetical protein